MPNTFPTCNAEYKIAIIGEAPGEHEIEEGQPFVGPSGQLLNNLLQSAGILRAACYVGNVCQMRPPGNDIKRFNWNGSEIQSGLEVLKHDLVEWRPNAVLLLGASALTAAGLPNHKVTEWRGSILQCVDVSSPFFGLKCIPSFHPAAVLRQWDWMPLLAFDLRRLRSEGCFPDLRLPQRTYHICKSADDAINHLRQLRETPRLTALDIEGYVNNITCISFSNNPLSAFVLPLKDYDDASLRVVLRELDSTLSDTSIPKVLQNGLYDQFCLAYTYGIHVANIVDDTMLAGWEIYPELPKGLATQASIYTLEPFYKFNRKSDDDEVHYHYCCTDSAVTLEIAQAQAQILDGPAAEHYRFNMSLLQPLLYMELRGIRYDASTAAQLLGETTHKISEVLSRLRTIAGPTYNPASPIQNCKLLYDTLALPTQHPKLHGRNDTTKRTADLDACLHLLKDYRSPALVDLLFWRKLDKDRVALSTTTDPDGRVRCSYNLVGTETGRLTCYESNTGSGSNLQTVTKKFRRLYLADEGFEMFQCDLSGADGWTVAAHSLALGDDTMYLDYLEGIKPAKVIALMRKYGREINNLSRAQLRERCAEISEDGPDGMWYFACKRIQHGTNYDMGRNTMALQICKDSYNKTGSPIYIPPKDCQVLQDLYRTRYRGITAWQNKIKATLANSRGFPTIPCASGHLRRFFGRRNDMETYKAALAHEPQANTTYATNLAIYRLWTDPENRTPSGTLIIEPLHQVHDALIGQWPTHLRDWARAKVRSYFANPITIAGTTLTIPFDGAYGRSWGELKNPL